MSELLRFNWKRCPQGYEFVYFPESWLKKRYSAEVWAEFLKSAPDWVGVDVLPAPSTAGDGYFLLPKSPHLEDFEPLKDNPVIFRNFAGLAETREAIEKFATQYGHLIRGNNALSSWIDEIRQMSLAVKQWENAKASGDYRHVRSAINVMPLTTRLKVEIKPGELLPDLALYPRNLLEALWVQFALAVAGDAKLNQCLHCKSWFQVGGGAGRKSGAFYCSQRCNNASYEKRSGRRTGKNNERQD